MYSHIFKVVSIWSLFSCAPASKVLHALVNSSDYLS